MIEVVLLEDEKFTREFFKKILLEIPEVSTVFDTADAVEAIRLAKVHQPDLILLDIELNNQDLNGLQVAKQIYLFNQESIMVFLTGYSKYALDSFIVHPYSYVVKPINVDEFTELIRKIAAKVENKRLECQDHLVLKTRGGTLHIPKRQIVFIEKETGHSLVHSYDGNQSLNRTLDELEQQLGNDFIRVHRSYIINT